MLLVKIWLEPMICVVQAFPPAGPIIDYYFAKERADAGEFRKIRIEPGAKEGNHAKQ